jgi:hypothetical protein
MTIFRYSRFSIAAILGVFAIASLLAYRMMDAQPKQPAFAIADYDRSAAPARTPVLVELFTSEGCSSCPPADALLARLLQQQPVPTADIIVLEEHVDYWESLGWHDRFSSHQFTDRQTSYAHALNIEGDYTPQMVVDGTAQFVGNDSTQALRAITTAAKTPKPALKLSPRMLDSGRLSDSVANASVVALPKADLYAALIETMASTDVKRGENGGRTLHHVSVVRAMQKVGTSEQLANPLFFSFAIPKDSVIPNLRVVAFVQRASQGSVLAAATSAPPPPID